MNQTPTQTLRAKGSQLALGSFSMMASQPALTAVVSLAVLYAFLAIIGGFLTFSPVPFWDMWDGALGFYVRQMTDATAWWAQHNEHRIVLSRVLFFIDYDYLGSNGAALIVINYLLACSAFGLLAWCALRRGSGRMQDSRLVAAFIMCLALLWTQNNNLTWAFQSQFFLANLLPLVALVLLHLSSRPSVDGNRWYYVGALVVATLAAISMANGILAASIVALGCLLGRQGWRRCAYAFTLAIAVPMLYFHEYTAPAGHGSVVESLRTEPLQVVKFFFAYIGSPLAHLDARGPLHVGWAIAGGVVLSVAGGLLSWRALFRQRSSVDVDLVVTLFLGYLVASALATAGSRALFGLEAAVASRYTTPALLMTSCILVLALRDFFKARPLTMPLQMGLALLALSFLPSQLTAARPQPYLDFERRFAALALEMGIKDDAQIGWIFPDAAWAQKIAAPAVGMDIGIFAEPGIYDAQFTLGGTYSMPLEGTCSLVGPERETLSDVSSGWTRLKGGLIAGNLPQKISTVLLLDARNTIVGRGLLAKPTQDVPGAPLGAPFKAYLTNRTPLSTYTIVVPGACFATVTQDTP